MKNEMACFKMQRANIQALITKSNDWRDWIDVLTRICADSIVVRGEKPTIDGESSPALPAKAVHAVKPSNNHYSILSDNDSPQVGETIDVQPEKQLEEPREKPVPAEQIVTVIGDEPREVTNADETIEDSPPVGEKIEDIPAEQTIPITGDKREDTFFFGQQPCHYYYTSFIGTKLF